MKQTLHFSALTAVVGLLVLSGCNIPHSEATTTIHRDGSFDRHVDLAGTDQVTIRKGKRISTRHMTRSESAREIARDFDIRGKGGRIVSLGTGRNRGYVWDRRRHYAAGQAATHDIVLKGGDGQDLVANETTVRPLGDGTWLYEERYDWIGKPLTDKDWIDPVLRKSVKSALGPGFDTAEIDKLTARFARSLLWVCWKPGGWMLDNHPPEPQSARDARLAKLLESAMNEHAANDSERAASHTLAQLALRKVSQQDGDALSNFPPSPNAAFQVGVWVPGKVLATDAKAGKDGMWGWLFFSPAPAVHDVDLRLVYRP